MGAWERLHANTHTRGADGESTECAGFVLDLFLFFFSLSLSSSLMCNSFLSCVVSVCIHPSHCLVCFQHPHLLHLCPPPLLLVLQVEERSKLNRQGSPKICTTVSDTNIQSRSDSINQSGAAQAAQTPPMQRPVEPQGGQGKVCISLFFFFIIKKK